MMLVMERKAQIATFKHLREQNYNKSMGWSVFTECYDDQDIATFFDDNDAPEMKTEADIERTMANIVSVWDDRYADAKHEGA